MSLRQNLRGMAAVVYGRFCVTLPIPTTVNGLYSQTFIVTGSNTGLGYESVKHLSRLGAGKIIMAVRTLSKGEEAKKAILAETKQPESSIEVWNIDMDSYDSIKNFCERANGLSRIDGILANAGVMTSNFSLSEGLEKQINVNVVSTFLLFLLLLPKMRESARTTGNPCRFSIPNSALHYMATTSELKPGEKGLLTRMSNPDTAIMANNMRYNVSKLLVIYAVREFAQKSTKMASGELDVIINTPNPSFCKSDLANEMQGNAGYATFEKVMARTTEEGSRTLVHGVLADSESNGHYLNNCQTQAYVTIIGATEEYKDMLTCPDLRILLPAKRALRFRSTSSKSWWTCWKGSSRASLRVCSWWNVSIAPGLLSK